MRADLSIQPFIPSLLLIKPSATLKKILILLLLIFWIVQTKAQHQQTLIGHWQGVLHVGKDLRMVFHFNQDNSGKWSASFDSPDQFASGIPCTEVQLKGDSVSLQVPSARASYRGIFMSDSSIKGEWIQMAHYDLTIKKTGKFATEVQRKQTP